MAGTRQGHAQVLDNTRGDSNLRGAKAATLNRGSPIARPQHVFDRCVDRRRKHDRIDCTVRRRNVAPLIRLAQSTLVERERMRIQGLDAPRGGSRDDDRPQSAPRESPEDAAVHLTCVKLSDWLVFV